MNSPSETIGAQLRHERERQGMTVQKAADDLRLDAGVITALESDTYEQTVPVVYARGHQRKYARLLGLSLDEAQLAPLPASAREAAPAPLPALATSTRPMRVTPRLPKIPLMQIGVAMLIVAILLLFWWSPWKHQVKVQAALPASEASVAAAPDASAADRVAGNDTAEQADGGLVNASAMVDSTPAMGTTASPAQAAPVAAAPVASAAASAPAPIASSGATVSLRLIFSATSWVDVRDATGRRLFVGHGYVNTIRTLAGPAPLTVRIGYMGGVRVEINDREVSIDRSLRNGDTARFLAGADGLPHPAAAKPAARG